MKICPICATSYPAGARTCPTHGTVLVDTPELPAGTTIRDCYRIERTLGKGGMGIVYLAEHTLMGEPRALKFLSSALSSNPVFVQRFLQEARAASKLRHPNIAATLELGQSEDGSFYISMEYVDGPSLRALLDEFPHGLPLDRALGIVRGVAGALAAAHANRMVHRDIKPENVLMANSAEGEIPKVVDFGIVAITDGPSRLTQTGKPLLTAEYAAPEQWRGAVPAHELDGRTDLYSLGCMFFEMLTGQLPFHADTYEGWFEKHVYTTPAAPSFLRPELARIPGLDGVVLHLLAKEREQRTGNVQEFLAELDRAVPNGLLASLGSASAPTELDVFQRRKTMLDNYEADRAAYGAAATPMPSVAPASQYAPAAFSAPQQNAGEPVWPVGFDTFGTPLQPSAGYGAGNGAIENGRQSYGAGYGPSYVQAPVAIPQQPLPAKASGMTQYRGVLIGAVVAFLLITLSAVGLVLVQRQKEQRQAADASMTPNGAAQTAPSTGQSTPQAGPQITQQGTGPDAHAGRVAQESSAANTLNKPTSGVPVSRREATAHEDTSAPAPVARPTPPTPAEVAQRALALYQQQQYAQAAPLFEQTCNGVNGDSCDHLGWMYEHGQGVPRDAKRSRELFAEACDDGAFMGCNHLASLYKNGEDTAQDLKRAITLYGKACNGGVMAACSDLGFMYQKPLGVEQDYAHAATLYEKACAGGLALACNNRGILYQSGQDYANAATYYTKACDGGNGRGCSDLGELYRTGTGVEKDAEKARQYLDKGCKMGNDWGCNKLKLVE